MISRIVNNVGVGRVEATMLNLTTTVATGSATPVTQALIDDLQKAVSLLGNNYVGQGSTTYNMFGAAIAASENDNDKNFPETLVVQVSGFVDMQGTTGDAAPAVNADYVLQQKNGFVIPEDTPAAGNVISRGKITEVYDTDTCVVFFG